MKKLIIFLAALLLFTGVTASAQEDNEKGYLLIAPRVAVSGFHTFEGNSVGFDNTILYSILKLPFGDGFTLSMSNRWARYNLSGTARLYTNLGRADDLNFFDILKVRWDIGRFFVQLGKDCMAYGNYTYDLYAQDYFTDVCDTFVANYQAYLWGGSIGYRITDRSDLMFQITDTPYSGRIFDSHCLAFTGQWAFSGENLSTLYTYNGVQRPDGSFMNYIALGHLYTNGPFTCQLDLSTHFNKLRHFFNAEEAVGLRLGWAVVPQLELYAQGVWECSRQGESEWGGYGPTWNIPGSCVPMQITPEKDLWLGAFTAFWFPLKDRSLRVHMLAAGNNYAKGGTLQLGATYFLQINFK